MSRIAKNPCLGCKDDFYNNKNSYGIKECWFKKKIRRGKCEYKYSLSEESEKNE